MKKMIFKSAALLAAFLGLSERADAQVDAQVSPQIKVSSAAQTQLQNKVLNTNPNAYFVKESGPTFVKSGAIVNPGANVGKEIFVKESGPAFFAKENGPTFVKNGAVTNPGANIGRDVFVRENGPSFVKSSTIAKPNVRVVRPGGGN